MSIADWLIMVTEVCENIKGGYSFESRTVTLLFEVHSEAVFTQYWTNSRLVQTCTTNDAYLHGNGTD